MSDEAVRKEFEAWANKQKWAEDEPPETSRDDIGRYNYSDVQYGWVAWQAAKSLYRSAAIQECAAELRINGEAQAVACIEALALKER